LTFAYIVVTSSWLYIGYCVSPRPSSPSCWLMAPSRRSRTFLPFRWRFLFFNRVPSMRQSSLQYFSENQPRNLRLQTTHVFRTFLSTAMFLSRLVLARIDWFVGY